MKKNISVFHMANGNSMVEIPVPRSAKGSPLWGHSVWIDDDHVLVSLTKKEKLKSLTCYSISAKKAIWTWNLPKKAQFIRTNRERGTLAGKFLLAATLTAVSYHNPLGTGNNSYFYYPSWRGRIHHSSSVIGEIPETVGDTKLEGTKKAQIRYWERQKKMEKTRGHEAYFVFGSLDHYQILSLDLLSGARIIAGTYVSSKVNSLEFFPLYRLAVAQEKNAKILKILSFPP